MVFFLWNLVSNFTFFSREKGWYFFPFTLFEKLKWNRNYWKLRSRSEIWKKILENSRESRLSQVTAICILTFVVFHPIDCVFDVRYKTTTQGTRGKRKEARPEKDKKIYLSSCPKPSTLIRCKMRTFLTFEPNYLFLGWYVIISLKEVMYADEQKCICQKSFCDSANGMLRSLYNLRRWTPVSVNIKQLFFFSFSTTVRLCLVMIWMYKW